MTTLSFDSQTSVMQSETEERFGKKIHVIDTPGLFDTKKDVTNEAILDEIKKAFIAMTPGPHAIILVIRIGRYGKEDRDTANIFVEYFGKEMLSHFFVIFTGADQLKGQQVHNLLKNTKQIELQRLIRNCRNRIVAFNNKDADSKQVTELIAMIEQNIRKNGGMHYSNDILKAIEQKIITEKMLPKEVERHVIEETSFGEKFLKVITSPIWGPFYLLGKAYDAVF